MITATKKDGSSGSDLGKTSSGDEESDAVWGDVKGGKSQADAISQILVSHDCCCERAGTRPLTNPILFSQGIAILEFGVVFHSFFIGLTLATDPQL